MSPPPAAASPLPLVAVWEDMSQAARQAASCLAWFLSEDLGNVRTVSCYMGQVVYKTNKVVFFVIFSVASTVFDPNVGPRNPKNNKKAENNMLRQKKKKRSI